MDELFELLLVFNAELDLLLVVFARVVADTDRVVGVTVIVDRSAVLVTMIVVGGIEVVGAIKDAPPAGRVRVTTLKTVSTPPPWLSF